MRTDRYRSWIARYGNLGVLLVGCVIGIHYLGTKRRSALCAALAALAVGGLWLWPRVHRIPPPAPAHTVPVVSNAPQENATHSLLKQAKKICSTTGWALPGRIMNAYPYMTYRWITDRRLLFFKGDERTGELLRQLEVETGKETLYRKISDWWSSDGSYKKDIEISPDGKWALWWGDYHDREFHGAYGAQLDGTGKFHLDLAYPLLEWLPDSRHFVAENAMRSVASPYQSLPLPAGFPEEKYFTDCRFASANRGIQVHQDHDGRFRIKKTTFGTGPARSKSWSIDVPPDETWKEPTLSPQGDRIAWICIRRLVRKVESDPQEVVHLRITRLDGSALQDLGAIDISQSDENEPLPAFFTEPYELKWLPDGAKLSFVYRDVLYTVPIQAP